MFVCASLRLSCPRLLTLILPFPPLPRAQTSLIKAGKADQIVQETRLWDEFKSQTFSMRKKEGLADYRYFPEPDLPPLVVTEEMVEGVKVRKGRKGAEADLPWPPLGFALCP